MQQTRWTYFKNFSSLLTIVVVNDECIVVQHCRVLSNYVRENTCLFLFPGFIAAPSSYQSPSLTSRTNHLWSSPNCSASGGTSDQHSSPPAAVCQICIGHTPAPHCCCCLSAPTPRARPLPEEEEISCWTMVWIEQGAATHMRQHLGDTGTTMERTAASCVDLCLEDKDAAVLTFLEGLGCGVHYSLCLFFSHSYPCSFLH